MICSLPNPNQIAVVLLLVVHLPITQQEELTKKVAYEQRARLHTTPVTITGIRSCTPNLSELH